MITKRDLMRTAGLAALTTAAGCAANSAAEAPRQMTMREIGEAAFLYGLPIVMNYGVMYEYVVDKKSGQWKAPFNHISNEARVFTYKDTAVVTPNSDTPYSLAWLDLRAEPIVLSVPAVDPKRYYAVMLCDGNTYNYGYIGSRATGNDAGTYMVVGPGWKGETPPGIRKVFQSSTDFSLVVYRTQLFDAADMPNVKRVQAGYRVTPLSAWAKRKAPAAAPKIAFPPINKDLAKTNFLEFLDFALQFAPAMPNEVAIRAQLARIGVGAGRTIAMKDLSADDRREIAAGMQDGEKKLEQVVAGIGANVNGWRVGSAQGDAAFFNGDWALRAAGAKLGIYGNNAEEAVYPFTRTDGAGQALDGAAHAYTLTFAANQLPPVNAFWSVTMYDGKTQLLIRNPINRYLINSPMLSSMKRNPDGSVTLYIQNAKPEADKVANWLPAPAGPIYLVMRLYWPRVEQPSILPAGKGTWAPPGIVRVS